MMCPSLKPASLPQFDGYGAAEGEVAAGIMLHRIGAEGLTSHVVAF